MAGKTHTFGVVITISTEENQWDAVALLTFCGFTFHSLRIPESGVSLYEPIRITQLTESKKVSVPLDVKTLILGYWVQLPGRIWKPIPVDLLTELLQLPSTEQTTKLYTWHKGQQKEA